MTTGSTCNIRGRIAPRRYHDTEIAHQVVLHRQISGNQCRVQEVSGRHSLSSDGRPQFSARLEERHLSRRMGEQAGDLGFARRRARLRRLGRQAPAARMGMAICRPGNRRPRCIPGAMSGQAAAVPDAGQAAEMRAPTDVDAHPEGRQPVWRDGPGGQRLAMDGRIRRRAHARRRFCAAAATISRRVRAGTSRRPTGSSNTASIC